MKTEEFLDLARVVEADAAVAQGGEDTHESVGRVLDHAAEAAVHLPRGERVLRIKGMLDVALVEQNPELVYDGMLAALASAGTSDSGSCRRDM